MNKQAEVIKADNPAREVWRLFLRNWSARLGLFIMVLIILVSIFGPGIYAVDPFSIRGAPFTPPGVDSNVPWGTDHVGRDILAGMLGGGRATLAVGLSAAVMTITIGLVVGAFSGYYGGLVDEILMRITEFFQVLPSLILAMVLVALFTPSLEMIAIAIGIAAWQSTARLTRGEFLRLRELEYVKASRTIGASDSRLMWVIILPNALPPLIISATLIIGVAILFEAGLSFLGLGDPNVMSWGLMIGSSKEYIFDSWWATAFPGTAIFLAVLSVSLIGDGLNDALNPKLRNR
ncbi:MAG: ABC transporter permease [Gammaproteobacteria bacterium]|nr:ABC transporter permease [Gammaproteobacteria bacterium]